MERWKQIEKVPDCQHDRICSQPSCSRQNVTPSGRQNRGLHRTNLNRDGVINISALHFAINISNHLTPAKKNHQSLLTSGAMWVYTIRIYSWVIWTCRFLSPPPPIRTPWTAAYFSIYLGQSVLSLKGRINVKPLSVSSVWSEPNQLPDLYCTCATLRRDEKNARCLFVTDQLRT